MNQLTLKCTARSAWVHCKEKKQSGKVHDPAFKKLLKFIFSKNYYMYVKMEVADLLGLILEMSMHNFVEMFLE